ncbi:MAG: hypothetical protein WC559_03000 [Candidatus Omnitrophota bacterium]
MPEKALFITKLEDVKYLDNNWERLYFGNEFCQHLLPPPEDIIKVIDFTKKNNLDLSLVTPVLNSAGVLKARDILRLFAEYYPGGEVVINDWGMLGECRKYSLEPIVGRLLTKQKRDPRIKKIMFRLAPMAQKRFKESGINPGYAAFLKENNIKHIELDCLLQGMDETFCRANGLCLSLYLPYGYISTTRRCIFNNNGFGHCSKECQKHSFRLRHPSFDNALLLKGNTLFFDNKIGSKDVLMIDGLKRIVYQPTLPI